MPTSCASVVEGLLSKFVDVAVLGPYSYVIANGKDKSIEVFATYAKKPGYLQEDAVLQITPKPRGAFFDTPVRLECVVDIQARRGGRWLGDERSAVEKTTAPYWARFA